MKHSVRKTAIALAVTAILGLSACNDNSESSATPVNKSTTGVITGFGSVLINGVEYETGDATFIIDGVEGSEELLKLGMVVSLSGTVSDDGTANAVSIEFDDDVEGVVISTSLDTDGNGTLNIMGITVHVDEDTVFESKANEILSVIDVVAGNIIEVSGHSSDVGDIWATRLEVKSAAQESGREMEMKGIISLLNKVSKTFNIGSVVVDFSKAKLSLDEGTSTLTDGMLIEVKSEQGFENEILIASKIELKNGGKKSIDHDPDADEVELEGIITKVVSTTEIEVNGHTVLLDDRTKYIHGSVETAMQGLKIKIKGDINDAEELVAQKVTFKPTGDIKLAGRIGAVDNVANTVTLFGAPFSLNNSTLVKDDRDEEGLGIDEENVKYKFGINDLVIGDWIKAKAYTNKDGGFTLTKMERKTYEQGKTEKIVGKLSINNETSTYFIAGIEVDLTGTDITPADGDKIELKGWYENGIFVASNGEFKESDEHYVGGDDADEGDLDEKHEDENNDSHNEDVDDEQDDLNDDHSNDDAQGES